MQATDWIDLSGKTAHVTGAGHGIGAAIARALALAGANVAVSDIDAAGAEETAAAVGGVGMALDVSDREAVDAALAATVDRLGGLDIMVNNAGVYQDLIGPVRDISDAMWRKLWSVNVDGVFYCCRAAARIMIEA
ncbi:MAG: SDR family NAD(P)-dependent oxidoreductase, partial [Gammaproteobacteria bacterium]|nr:SDR family NAD(P)-dependent oxidoreductase [Gammaproteobacteria bacterium]